MLLERCPIVGTTGVVHLVANKRSSRPIIKSFELKNNYLFNN